MSPASGFWFTAVGHEFSSHLDRAPASRILLMTMPERQVDMGGQKGRGGGSGGRRGNSGGRGQRYSGGQRASKAAKLLDVVKLFSLLLFGGTLTAIVS